MMDRRDRSDFEVRLREERQSAARGLELLTLVQSTLSGAFNKAREDAQNQEAPAPQAQVVAAARTETLVETSPAQKETAHGAAVETAESVAAVSA